MKKLIRKILAKFRIIKNLESQPPPASGFITIDKDDIRQPLSDAWKDPLVPLRQYESCTRTELENYRNGLAVEPYDVLVSVLKDSVPYLDSKSLLEIGCSSGYYSEVLRIKNIKVKYNGCDYSEAFIDFAKAQFPGVDFQKQDACGLEYRDGQFDIVVSGCCLLHILDYSKAIREAVRVAKEFVIFHRTPVLHSKETSYCLKTAYEVEMFEIHFNERELFKLFRENDLRIIDIITFNIAYDQLVGDFFAYKTYLCEKKQKNEDASAFQSGTPGKAEGLLKP